VGRIRLEYTNSISATTSPAATVGFHYTTAQQTWVSQTTDAGAGNTYQPNLLRAFWTLDGSDNLVPQVQVLASSTGAFAGEETTFPAGPGTYYQSGGTYSLGGNTDLTTTVTSAFRYWRVKAYLTGGSTNTTDTPILTSISLGQTKPLTLVASALKGDPTYSLRLQAAGSLAGNGQNGSIYFLDNSGNTTGRFDTAISSSYGSGADGALTITQTSNCQTGTGDFLSNAMCKMSNITVTTTASPTITVASTTGFLAGNEILIIQMAGTGVGTYETGTILTINGGTTLTLTTPLTNTYQSTNAQIVRIPQFTDLIINNGGTLTTSAWNGTTGGVLFFRATGTITINSGGIIDMNGLGGSGGGTATGGAGGAGLFCNSSQSGNGTAGTAGTANAGTGPAGGGGGGGGGGAGVGNGGGGGGSGGGGSGGSYLTAASTATVGTAGGAGNGGAAGTAGTAGSPAAVLANNSFTASLFMGSGGGSGGSGGGGAGGGCGDGTSTQTQGGTGGTGGTGGSGGNGGGIVAVFGKTIVNNGTVRSNGSNGSGGTSGTNGGAGQYLAGLSSGGGAGGGGGGAGGSGGGGSGGTIWFSSNNITTGSLSVTGGNASTNSGVAGGNGGGCDARNGDGGRGGGGGGAPNGVGGSSGCNGGGSTAGSSGSGAGSNSVSGRTSSSSVSTYGTMYAGAFNTSAADVAEHYASRDTLSPGNLVTLDPESKTSVLMTTKSYDEKTLGIVSTNPGLILGQGEQENATLKTYPIALSGRIPVLISQDSAPIKIGDYLTSSNEPGRAMKATVAGPIVAMALENWDPMTGGSMITAFVHLGFYDPDAMSGGTLVDKYDLMKIPSGSGTFTYQIKNAFGDVITRAMTLGQAMIADLTAGTINAQQIATTSLTVDGQSIQDLVSQAIDQKLTSPLASGSGQLATGITKNGENLMIQLGSSDSTDSASRTLTIANRYSDPVATIDESGNANFAGSLRAKNGTFDHLTLNDASISGVLYANQIEGLQARISSIIADTIGTGSVATSGGDLVASITDTNSDILNRISQLENTTASLGGNLMASASFDTLSVHSALTVASTLLFDQTGINSTADTLAIQGSGHGTVSLLAGAMTLDQNGLIVNTDAYFAKSVAIKEDLMVDVIKSSNGDIAIHLATPSSQLSDRLAVVNNQTQEVASIDASGSARFNKLMIASDRDDPNATATISGQYQTNASTGESTLPTGTRTLKIISPKIGDNSLVYVTPTSSTNNQVLYVKSKHVADPLIPNDTSYFVISIDTPIAIPVQFNWWVIN